MHSNKNKSNFSPKLCSSTFSHSFGMYRFGSNSLFFDLPLEVAEAAFNSDDYYGLLSFFDASEFTIF